MLKRVKVNIPDRRFNKQIFFLTATVDGWCTVVDRLIDTKITLYIREKEVVKL